MCAKKDEVAGVVVYKYVCEKCCRGDIGRRGVPLLHHSAAAVRPPVKRSVSDVFMPSCERVLAFARIRLVRFDCLLIRVVFFKRIYPVRPRSRMLDTSACKLL